MKKNVLWMLLDLVFVVVFNVVFFVAGGTTHTATAWISYAFILFAYVMVLATPILTRKSSSQAVFGFALYIVSSVYFFVELIVGLVFIFLNGNPVKAAIIMQVIIAGIYLVILISHLIANENTADSLEQHEKEVAFIKQSSARVKALLDRLDGKEANKSIEEVYDLLHSSPSKTSPDVWHLEKSILDTITELEEAVASNNESAAIAKVQQIISMAEQRNLKLRSIQ